MVGGNVEDRYRDAQQERFDETALLTIVPDIRHALKVRSEIDFLVTDASNDLIDHDVDRTHPYLFGIERSFDPEGLILILLLYPYVLGIGFGHAAVFYLNRSSSVTSGGDAVRGVYPVAAGAGCGAGAGRGMPNAVTAVATAMTAASRNTAS